MEKRRRKILNWFLYVCYLFAVIIISLELLLRLYYPFQRKTRGGKWKLSTNIIYQLHNNHQPRLDRVVINKRNSIGFRGEDPVKDMHSRFTILTVGGSTTACTFLTEGKTWTDKLGTQLQKEFPAVWINNAGLDGHSTYGHLNFMYYYFPTLSFRPNVIIFLIGANDVDRNDLSFIDSSFKGSVSGARSWLENHSETINFFIDLKWMIHPVDIFKDTPDWSFTDFKNVHLTPAYIDSALNKQNEILPAFRKRLCILAELCRTNNIEPVFVTQPSVFGDGTWPGGNPAIDFHVYHQTENGQLFWKKLALFNNITRQVSGEKQVYCIDLGQLMPKDTSYYYDVIHFTNAGAQKVADILFDGLSKHFTKQFPNYQKK